MSGGYFDGREYNLIQVSDDIEDMLNRAKELGIPESVALLLKEKQGELRKLHRTLVHVDMALSGDTVIEDLENKVKNVYSSTGQS